MTSDQNLELIEEQADSTIRRMEIDGTWYFSVIDVVAILTDAPKPRQYWFNMKRYIKSEGFLEVSQKVRQLKLPSSDGKYYSTDAADVEVLLRIIQSIPSPKAEPIKQWLAKTGAKKLQHMATTTPVPLRTETTIDDIKRQKPADDDLLGMAEWYEQLARVYRQQASMESRLRLVETVSRSQSQQLEDLALRLDRVEEAQELLPDLLERLRPEHLTQEHQSLVRRWIQEVHLLTGWHYTAIYHDLVADFAYQDFSDVRETDWERIADWFRRRLEEARKRR